MDCIVTVAKKGRLQQDWTGTVKEAIKDWDVFYRAVFNHVRDCDKCNPTEVLQAYWALRQKPKHGGRTSVGLAALAYRYHRIGADLELVKQFIARSGDVVRYAHLFSDESLYEAICESVNFELGDQPGQAWPFSSAIRDIEKHLEKHDRPFLKGVVAAFQWQLIPPFEDITRLAVVAEVTLS